MLVVVIVVILVVLRSITRAYEHHRRIKLSMCGLIQRLGYTPMFVCVCVSVYQCRCRCMCR